MQSSMKPPGQMPAAGAGSAFNVENPSVDRTKLLGLANSRSAKTPSLGSLMRLVGPRAPTSRLATPRSATRADAQGLQQLGQSLQMQQGVQIPKMAFTLLRILRRL